MRFGLIFSFVLLSSACALGQDNVCQKYWNEQLSKDKPSNPLAFKIRDDGTIDSKSPYSYTKDTDSKTHMIKEIIEKGKGGPEKGTLDQYVIYRDETKRIIEIDHNYSVHPNLTTEYHFNYNISGRCRIDSILETGSQWYINGESRWTNHEDSVNFAECYKMLASKINETDQALKKCQSSASILASQLKDADLWKDSTNKPTARPSENTGSQ